MKKRWEDPEFRIKYSESTRGNRSHSNETKARIAAAITMKWLNDDYRAKVSSPPSDEVKARYCHFTCRPVYEIMCATTSSPPLHTSHHWYQLKSEDVTKTYSRVL